MATKSNKIAYTINVRSHNTKQFPKTSGEHLRGILYVLENERPWIAIEIREIEMRSEKEREREENRPTENRRSIHINYRWRSTENV